MELCHSLMQSVWENCRDKIFLQQLQNGPLLEILRSYKIAALQVEGEKTEIEELGRHKPPKYTALIAQHRENIAQLTLRTEAADTERLSLMIHCSPNIIAHQQKRFNIARTITVANELVCNVFDLPKIEIIAGGGQSKYSARCLFSLKLIKVEIRRLAGPGREKGGGYSIDQVQEAIKSLGLSVILEKSQLMADQEWQKRKERECTEKVDVKVHDKGEKPQEGTDEEHGKERTAGGGGEVEVCGEEEDDDFDFFNYGPDPDGSELSCDGLGSFSSSNFLMLPGSPSQSSVPAKRKTEGTEEEG